MSTLWPRIRELPEHERAPFKKVLDGQTRPEINGIDWDSEDQDAFYPWDYQRWKEGLPVID